jgi:hypothetical protein
LTREISDWSEYFLFKIPLPLGCMENEYYFTFYLLVKSEEVGIRFPFNPIVKMNLHKITQSSIKYPPERLKLQPTKENLLMHYLLGPIPVEVLPMESSSISNSLP